MKRSIGVRLTAMTILVALSIFTAFRGRPNDPSGSAMQKPAAAYSTSAPAQHTGCDRVAGSSCCRMRLCECGHGL